MNSKSFKNTPRGHKGQLQSKYFGIISNLDMFNQFSNVHIQMNSTDFASSKSQIQMNSSMIKGSMRHRVIAS